MAKELEAPRAKLLTPKGRVVWATIHKPDVKYEAAGRYQLKLAFENSPEIEAVLTKLTTLRDSFVAAWRAEMQAGDGKSKAKAKTVKVRDVAQPAYDKEGDETGELILSASMKASGVSKKDGKAWERAPAVFDAAGKKLVDVPAVYGGSAVKMAVEAQAYYKAADNEIGVALRLEAVQVIDLVTGGNRDASDYGFGQEDGFVADEPSDSPFGGSAASAGGAANAGDPAEF